VKGQDASRGSRGDLYVRLDVAVPTHLSEEQRTLLEEVDAKVGPDAYAPADDEDEGFFQRLKSALR
jgi:DnaJ-class molecular chaperone